MYENAHRSLRPLRSEVERILFKHRNKNKKLAELVKEGKNRASHGTR